MNDQTTASASAASTSKGKFRRRVAISLIVLLLFAGASIVVANYLCPQTYTAEAWLMINEGPVPLLAPAILTDEREQFVKNQLEIIRNPALLTPLAANAAIVETPELAGER